MNKLLEDLNAILTDLGEPCNVTIQNDLSVEMVKDLEMKIAIAREEQVRNQNLMFATSSFTQCHSRPNVLKPTPQSLPTYHNSAESLTSQ